MRTAAPHIVALDALFSRQFCHVQVRSYRLRESKYNEVAAVDIEAVQAFLGLGIENVFVHDKGSAACILCIADADLAHGSVLAEMSYMSLSVILNGRFFDSALDTSGARRTMGATCALSPPSNFLICVPVETRYACDMLYPVPRVRVPGTLLYG